MPLTANEIERFFADGYLIVPGVLRDDEVAAVRAGCDALEAEGQAIEADGKLDRAGVVGVTHEGGHYTFDHQPDEADAERRTQLRHVSWPGRVAPVLDALGADGRYLSLAAALLGSASMDQLINQIHFKRPGTTVAFPWHQDCVHRGMPQGLFDDVNGRGSFVQIVTAIDDFTEDNGPLMVVPYSHRDGCGSGATGEYGRLDPSLVDEAKAITPMLKAGDAVIFGPYLIHGSEPNVSSWYRRVFINGYAYPGANRREYVGYAAGRRLVVDDA